MNTPNIVATSKLAQKDYAKIQTGYSDTMMKIQQHMMNKAQMQMQQQSMQMQEKSMQVPPKDPMEGVDFETHAKANPAGAFQRANGRTPNEQELKDFQGRMTPPEPVSGQEVIDKISKLLE